MDKPSFLRLGAWRQLDGGPGGAVLRLPVHHLVTHGVVVGMTGSGKTGLLTVLLEETLNAGIPALIIDVKGDLPNLLLSFPDCESSRFAPWLADLPTEQEATIDWEDVAKQASKCAQHRPKRSESDPRHLSWCNH